MPREDSKANHAGLMNEPLYRSSLAQCQFSQDYYPTIFPVANCDRPSMVDSLAPSTRDHRSTIERLVAVSSTPSNVSEPRSRRTSGAH